jgi:hypothetical protein
MARSIKPAPMPKPRSRQMTDVTPKRATGPKTKSKIDSKVQPLKPKPKGRIFKGTSTTTPALPSSSSKMGKMNRGAY